MATAQSKPVAPFRKKGCGHTFRAATCKVCPHCFGMRVPVQNQSNDNIKDSEDA